MKIGTLIGIITLAVIGCLIATPSTSVSAQELHSQMDEANKKQIVLVPYCCDGDGNHRCAINYTPIGNACLCPGQGWGWACL